MRAVALMSEFSDESSAEALMLLDQAIAIDLGYARAHGHKAWAAIWRAIQGGAEMDDALGDLGFWSRHPARSQ